MTEFLFGMAVAAYLIVAGYLVSDGLVRGWEWAAVVLWPVAIPARRLYMRWRKR